MKLCAYLHDEIVFDEPHCPMCSMRDDYENHVQAMERKHSIDMDDLQGVCDGYLNIIRTYLPEHLI